MNTLTREEWEDLEKHLASAKSELNSACEIISKNHIDTPLGLQFEEATGESHTQCSNALYAAQEEKKRLMKEAQEDKA